MNEQEVVLASSSVTRQQILAKHGILFSALEIYINERSARNPDAEALTLALAQAKVIEAVMKLEGQNRTALVIAAHQVVCWNGKITEVPKDEAEARCRLQNYPKVGKLETVSAIHVWNMYNGSDKGGVERAPFTVAHFTESEIEQIVADPQTYQTSSGLPSGKLKDSICNLVERHKLYYYDKYRDSINGLPMNLLRSLCDVVGFDLAAVTRPSVTFGVNNPNMA